MKPAFSLIFFLILLLFSANSIKAESEEKYITVVNPVRISSYTKDPADSLRSEYGVVRRNKLPATWLFTFDALENPGVVKEAKAMDDNQEFGIFLEITPKFAESAGVVYHNTGFWHHATSVFLSGYTQEERSFLIDSVFAEFKNVFGYYPVSVGSWWTDSFSLSYMREKYGISINLTCSDQLSTDGYQIWGQPWGIPYYPSKFFTAVPASNEEAKIGVINIQWAPRDPVNGYGSSLFSTQDYLVAPKPQNTDYFKKLVNLYTASGQITVGLEADLDPSVYRKEYSNQMEVIRKKKEEGVSIVTMEEFADRYSKKYPSFSTPTLIESEDFLGSGAKAFWYMSKNYRLFYTKDDNSVRIKDLRIYNPELTEPYYKSPNYSFNLALNVPFVINEAESGDVWILPRNAEVIPEEDRIVIKGNDIKVSDILVRSDLVDLKTNKDGIEVRFSTEVPGKFGLTVKGLTSEAVHFFRQKKALFNLLAGNGWNHFEKIDYLIPQGEVYALFYLKSLPAGRVMVFDGECLQCDYHTELKPAVFANQRKYVKSISSRPMVRNSSVFGAKTREEAKKELTKTRTKYIYLVKFEDYEEKLPFSPGDLGIEKIFSNANAEIWRVK